MILTRDQFITLVRTEGKEAQFLQMFNADNLTEYLFHMHGPNHGGPVSMAELATWKNHFFLMDIEWDDAWETDDENAAAEGEATWLEDESERFSLPVEALTEPEGHPIIIPVTQVLRSVYLERLNQEPTRSWFLSFYGRTPGEYLEEHHGPASYPIPPEEAETLVCIFNDLQLVVPPELLEIAETHNRSMGGPGDPLQRARTITAENMDALHRALRTPRKPSIDPAWFDQEPHEKIYYFEATASGFDMRYRRSVNAQWSHCWEVRLFFNKNERAAMRVTARHDNLVEALNQLYRLMKENE